MGEERLSPWTAWLGTQQSFVMVGIRLFITTLAGVAICWLLLARWDRQNYQLIVGLLLRPPENQSTNDPAARAAREGLSQTMADE
jgi:hypothetical protein